MPERGATPNVHPVQRRVLRALAALSSPLLPDDYLELINPLWSTRELRGRIEDIDHETDDAATVLIKPGYRWGGHQPGQYLRIGVDIEGVRHWRAYSLTSDPGARGRADQHHRQERRRGQGLAVPGQARPARAIVSLGGVEGEFLLPDPLPEKLLFVSAGSGITPIMSMLRHLDQAGELGDVVLLHSARKTDEVIFGDELRALADAPRALRPARTAHRRQRTDGPGRPGSAVPGLARARDVHLRPERDAGRVQRALRAGRRRRAAAHGALPAQAGARRRRGGDGREITFLNSDTKAESDGSQPILVAGEEAGLDLPYGCREGVCHTCVGELRSGRVRDLRTGEVHGEEGEVIRTCIHAPEGPIEIEL